MTIATCKTCGRRLSVEGDELSADCAGDCWGCVGEIEADAGYEPSLRKVIEEWRRGLRPNWTPPSKVIDAIEVGGSIAEQENPNPPLRVVEARERRPGDRLPFDLAIFYWHERRQPSGVFECVHGDRISIDLPLGVTLVQGMVLILEDGRHVEGIDAEE